VRRRAFISLLGGAAAWPLAARAQQPERMRRIGALMNFAATDQEGQARFAAFVEGLQELGWANGRNVQIDNRWVGSDADYIRKHAVELAQLRPDVILASATITLVPLQQATGTIPIVFASAIDPVGTGLIASMAGPGGNATGFVAFEYSMSTKWLELLN
jgi:putative ABC transport system substrate-binding protein